MDMVIIIIRMSIRTEAGSLLSHAADEFFEMGKLLSLFVKTGNLIYYIAPRMENYVKFSAVALYMIAVYQVYAGLRAIQGHIASCDCEHPPARSFLRNTAVYSFFIIPLALGFLMPNTAMSSALADKKGMNLSIGTTQKSGVKPAQASAATASTISNPAVTAAEPKNDPIKTDSGSLDGTTSAADPQKTGTETASSKSADGTHPAQTSGSPQEEELKKMFAPPDKFSEDLSQIGMVLYGWPDIRAAPLC
ncbi:DUF1980 domain-containing protein [Paenibacillus filicis]|uniref:DUF1980 domain-containing protein n=1 Tax=Paenibacillus gyeongsangnamensis TaxID=3388067 RepID=A0ABT4QE11_9BACL|nr:DUF1980 domain-containing protein [Paenibacillus filicis]MCZ8515032.1 DUF1980 domain-containing protein [Paenibacillus filicis]